MISAKTWHPQSDQQTYFAWDVVDSGIQIHHSVRAAAYTVNWESFHSVHLYAHNRAQTNEGLVIVGACVDQPSPGSVGEWLMEENLALSSGRLSPKHLSFLGPIYGHMGFIEREIVERSIAWRFPLNKD